MLVSHRLSSNLAPWCTKSHFRAAAHFVLYIICATRLIHSFLFVPFKVILTRALSMAISVPSSKSVLHVLIHTIHIDQMFLLKGCWGVFYFLKLFDNLPNTISVNLLLLSVYVYEDCPSIRILMHMYDAESRVLYYRNSFLIRRFR